MNDWSVWAKYFWTLTEQFFISARSCKILCFTPVITDFGASLQWHFKNGTTQNWYTEDESMTTVTKINENNVFSVLLAEKTYPVFWEQNIQSGITIKGKFNIHPSVNTLLPRDQRFGALNLLIVKWEEKFLQGIPVNNNSNKTVLHKAEIQNDWDYK